MSKVKLVDNVRIIPARLIVSRMVSKQRMATDILSVEREPSVFNSYPT